MTSIDPINTTAADGRECHVCGEDATCMVFPVGDLFPSAICRDCRHDEITDCERCQRQIWAQHSYRLTGSGLWCADCYYQHPVVLGGIGVALANDERGGK